jgi:regulator of sirC expression with transglutaminase-like and TPR domain
MTESGVVEDKLKAVGALPDSAIDLAYTALLFAELHHPGISFDRYVQHLRLTGEEVAARHKALLAAGADDNAETQLAALKHILADRQSLHGAEEDYENMENADLMRVIDRKRGLPIALSILYIDAARRQGWAVNGLNLPGHFVLRVDKDSDRIIFDPFNACKVLQAPDLRRIVKDALGPSAELSASYYESCTNRQILLRLQNNIKLRQIQLEQYSDALETVRVMQLADPEEYRLLLDAGVLLARVERSGEAVESLEAYMQRTPSPKDRHDAALLLQHIRSTLE